MQKLSCLTQGIQTFSKCSQILWVSRAFICCSLSQYFCSNMSFSPLEEERTTVFSQSIPKVFLFVLAVHGGLQESVFSYCCILLEYVWSIKKPYWAFSLVQCSLSLPALLLFMLSLFFNSLARCLLYFISFSSPSRSGGLEILNH